MLGGSGLPPRDLPALLQFGITALALVCGLLFVVRNAASRFFVVDAGFNAADAGGYEGGRGEMSFGDDSCFVCGRRGTKKCARCKSVRYCSQECQAKHWKDGHKHKCKEPKLLNDSIVARTSERRKTSGFGSSIALVPARGSCKVLEQPKKILFPYDEFVKLFNWDKQNFSPCGLVNCGNSCFANVVLQCLSCTRPLVAYLLEGSHSKTCSKNDWCFLCELQTHIQKVSQSMKPFSPINILSRLPKIGGNLGHGRQEDAHEFMRFAIDTMQSVCLDEFGGEKSLDASVQETTLIQHIFGGHLQSQVKCTKCDKISNRYENMMDLTVEIQGDAESLEECLNQFTGKEWLDGENMYKCDGCDEYVKAWKRLTVHQSPNILTVALKRFQGGRFGKLNKRVTFPETLDLRPYMSGAGDGTDLYTLYAVVVHIDMLNASFFGHYICYTKDFYGNWYRIDDCKVMKVDVEEVLAQGAYMLLYNRISVRQPSIKHPDTSKIKDAKSVETTPASLNNSVLTNFMENQSEQESFQRKAEDLDLHMPAKVDVEPVVQDSGDVGLNVLQSMDLGKVQEIDLGRPQKMDLDESPESGSLKAVDGDLDAGRSVPENLDSALSEQNPSSLKEFEGKTHNFQAPVDYQFMKENGPIIASDECFNDAAKTSISIFIPAIHEMPEPIDSNESEQESFQSKVEDLDLHMPAKVDVEPVVQGLGDVGLNVLQSMDLDKVQEIDLDRHRKMDLDEFPESDSVKAVDDNLDAGSSVPENLDSVLSEQNSSSLKEFEGKTHNFQASVDYQFMKENGPIIASNECFNDAAKASISIFIPAVHEIPESIESNPSCPRSGHVTPVDGLSGLAIGVNCLHNSSSSSGSQEDLESLCIDSMSTELEQPSSCSFLDKNSIVKEDRNIENGVGDLCGRNNCDQLECECEISSSKENLKPLFYPGFLDNHIQMESPNEETMMKSSEVGHPGNNFAGTMEISQLNNTTVSLPYSDDCNGLLHEYEKLIYNGSPEPLYSPEFVNGHAQKAPPNGKSETESSAVGIPCKIPTENGQLDFYHSNNGNCNGLLHESGKSSAKAHSKPLFSRGFLDHRAEKRPLKGKTQKKSGGTISWKDNATNHIASYNPQSIQQNGDDYDANQKSMFENREHIILDSPDVPLISRGFLNKSYETSQNDAETSRNNQSGYGFPGKDNCNRC